MFANFIRIGFFIALFSLILPPMAFATSGTLFIAIDTVLTEDHTGDIIITADDVTLDCDGYRVIGDSTTNGIELVGRSGVTIQHCEVVGHDEIGILVDGGSDNTIYMNTASGNNLSGILVINSSYNLVAQNTMEGNGLDGITNMNTAQYNTIIRNIASNNGNDGIFLAYEANRNKLIGNRMNGNGRNGLTLTEASRMNTIWGNRALDNVDNGIWLVLSEDNKLIRNVACRNGSFNVRQELSEGNIFFRNRFCSPTFGL